MNDKEKVFLGGTCNDSTWRNELIPMLKIDYFNPVVDDWTPDAQLEEERQKEICTIHLYVITPQMKGVFSIAEAVQSSNEDAKNGKTTIFCVLKEHNGVVFEDFQIKSLDATSRLVAKNGAYTCTSLEECAEYMNKRAEKLSYADFVLDVYAHAYNRPKSIRFGQDVFNYVEEKYHVGKIVQRNTAFDCFYNDGNTHKFLIAAFDVLKNQQENKR